MEHWLSAALPAESNKARIGAFAFSRFSEVVELTLSEGPQMFTRRGQDAQRATQASQAIALRDAKIDKLSFELAQLRLIRFCVKSEQLDVQQRPLFEESVQPAIAALEEELVHISAHRGQRFRLNVDAISA